MQDIIEWEYKISPAKVQELTEKGIWEQLPEHAKNWQDPTLWIRKQRLKRNQKAKESIANKFSKIFLELQLNPEELLTETGEELLKSVELNEDEEAYLEKLFEQEE